MAKNKEYERRFKKARKTEHDAIDRSIGNGYVSIYSKFIICLSQLVN